MKNFRIFFLTLCLSWLINSSCNKINSDIPKEYELSEYTNSAGQQRLIFAKLLISTLSANSEMESIAIQECYKMFDGDRNVMLKDLLKKQIKKTNSDISFGKILNENSGNTSFMPLKSGSIDDLANSLVTNDSLIQLYFYRSSMVTDSLSWDGIVVLPKPFNEKTDKELILIKRDGSETTIRSDIDPDKNYLVISQNERSSCEWQNMISQLKSANITTTEPDYSVYKDMAITNACFTSLDGKRSVESWAAGEPEVRVTIIYGVWNHTTNTLEPRQSSFIYPHNWLRTKWFKNYVKWVGVQVSCPRWYKNEQSFDRKIRWTEEDGDTNERTVTTSLTNPNAGITTGVTIKIPASEGDVVIAESYIDYLSPTDGEVTWGVMKFELKF